MPQSVFSWCFLSVSRYFSIARNLCWEPHCWAENRIFKNFSKSLKTCLVGVFWVFHVFLSIVRHLSREPDFWVENSVFKSWYKRYLTKFITSGFHVLPLCRRSSCTCSQSPCTLLIICLPRGLYKGLSVNNGKKLNPIGHMSPECKLQLIRNHTIRCNLSISHPTGRVRAVERSNILQ